MTWQKSTRWSATAGCRRTARVRGNETHRTHCPAFRERQQRAIAREASYRPVDRSGSEANVLRAGSHPDLHTVLPEGDLGVATKKLVPLHGI